MKSERLLYALTGARDDFVDQAAPAQTNPARPWLKYAALAACLCAVLAGVLALGTNRRAPTAPDALPLIDLPELGVGGMGFEGYMYYDSSEIKNGNPWREDMVFETMPVFKNGAYDASNLGVPLGLDGDEVMRRLERAVAALGLEIRETKTELDEVDYEAMERYRISHNEVRQEQGLRPIEAEAYNRRDGAVISITALTERGTIRADANGDITCNFSSAYPWKCSCGIEPIRLPKGYSMTYHDTTEEQALKTTKYLTKKYAELLNFDDPAYEVCGWHGYNIYGEYTRSYDVYDAAGDDLQDLLNFCFCQVSFLHDEEGRLDGIRLTDDLAVLEKIGDYPIIGIDQARERLIAGQYQTSVPYDMPGEEYIAKVELMYRNSVLEEVFLPYYCFYVELPEGGFAGEELGLKTFGAYYVPAIESQYIGSAETYHGQFN